VTDNTIDTTDNHGLTRGETVYCSGVECQYVSTDMNGRPLVQADGCVVYTAKWHWLTRGLPIVKSGSHLSGLTQYNNTKSYEDLKLEY